MHSRFSAGSRPVTNKATVVAVSPKTASNSKRLLAVLGTLLLSLTLVAFPAQRAFSHDYLMNSSPEDGATLDAQPKQIVLGFSGEIQDLGAQVVIQDINTDIVAQGAPTIDGKNVSFDVPLELGNGVFTVNWRVVSSDAHPIEGTLSYTVAGAEQEVAPTPAESESPAPESPSPEATQAPEESPAPTTEPSPGTEAPTEIPWTGIIIAGAAGLGIGILLMVLPKRKKQRGESTPQGK